MMAQMPIFRDVFAASADFLAPIDPALPMGKQNKRAKDNAIPGEAGEAMRRDELEQPTDTEISADKSRQ